MLPPQGCDSSCGQAGGSCQNNKCVIVQNSGGIDPGTVTKLQGGGSGDATFKWVYPYDQTVFPRGLIPATMQFAGVSADAIYVHMSSASLDYKGYFKGTSGAINLALPAAAWTAVLEATGALPDQLQVEVTKLSSGKVAGPITETWTVAQGSLHGTIYYETYNSKLQTAAGGVGGVGIMNIAPGATQPTVLKTGCGNVCHTASADGSTLVADQSLLSSGSYDLHSNASSMYNAPDQRFAYLGLYPDGSFGMSATNFRTWIPSIPSRLFDTKTGANIPAPGWDSAITNAGTTAFSPDGMYLAFVREDVNGNTLSMMDFNVATKTFSNLVDLAVDPRYVGWPAFTPDSKWVVYHSGTNDAFETDSGAQGNVMMVNVATKQVSRLTALDGYTGTGSPTYLPASDPDLSFAPTVLPEAVGGYFWVVFTSHRSYGNLLPSKQGGDTDGKLWVAALDLNATPGADGSHPAFYLDGQELEADNLRGFWVLSPCQANGTSCTSGDECCGGFCRPSGGNGPLECVPPPGGCSNVYETRTTASNCCDSSSNECINGRCAQAGAPVASAPRELGDAPRRVRRREPVEGDPRLVEAAVDVVSPRAPAPVAVLQVEEPRAARDDERVALCLVEREQDVDRLAEDLDGPGGEAARAHGTHELELAEERRPRKAPRAVIAERVDEVGHGVEGAIDPPRDAAPDGRVGEHRVAPAHGVSKAAPDVEAELVGEVRPDERRHPGPEGVEPRHARPAARAAGPQAVVDAAGAGVVERGRRGLARRIEPEELGGGAAPERAAEVAPHGPRVEPEPRGRVRAVPVPPEEVAPAGVLGQAGVLVAPPARGLHRPGARAAGERARLGPRRRRW